MSESESVKRPFDRALVAKMEARRRAAQLPFEDKVRRMLQLAANLSALKASNPHSHVAETGYTAWVTLPGSPAGGSVRAESTQGAITVHAGSVGARALVFGSSASSKAPVRFVAPPSAGWPTIRGATSGVGNRVDVILVPRTTPSDSGSTGLSS